MTNVELPSGWGISINNTPIKDTMLLDGTVGCIIVDENGVAVYDGTSEELSGVGDIGIYFIDGIVAEDKGFLTAEQIKNLEDDLLESEIEESIKLYNRYFRET